MLLSKFINTHSNSSTGSRAIFFRLRNALNGNKVIARHGSSRRLLRSRYIFRFDFLKTNMIRYLLIGFVPCFLLQSYCNLFIGDAELYDHDPEVFEPEHYEYYKHPVTRFLAKYVMEDPKLSYYKDLYMVEQAQRSYNQGKVIEKVESLQKLEREGMIQLQRSPSMQRTLTEDLEEFYEENLKEPRGSS